MFCISTINFYMRKLLILQLLILHTHKYTKYVEDIGT